MENTNILKKWGPILEDCGISTDYIENVSEYVEEFARAESEGMYSTLGGCGMGSVGIGNVSIPSTPYESVLPLNVNIISEIKDLSKVTFMKAPIQEIDGNVIHVGDMTFNVDLDSDEYELHKFYEKYEPQIIEKISTVINDLIDKGNHIYMYKACQSIKVISEENVVLSVGDIKRPLRMYAISRFHYKLMN